MGIKSVGAALAATVLAALASGCGGSSSSSGTGSVVRAADATAASAGYRMSGTVTVANPVSGPISMKISGSFDRADKLGTLRTFVDTAGRRVQVSELLSGLTIYMASAGIPEAARLGKPWVEINMSRASGAISVSSLPTATNPTQFVDYLRAISSNTTRVGTQTIGGLPTTEYRANVDLDRYPALVPKAQRASVTRSIKQLESALGSHTFPLDVWVDHQNLVRRIGLGFAECVSGTNFRFEMTMNLFDFGAQPKPKLPAAGDVYNLTPLISAGLRHAKIGCS